jgi:hypothetical protein
LRAGELRCLPPAHVLTSCSYDLSATSQQYFSLKTNQPPTTAINTFLSEQISHQQPTGSTFLSEQISTSHQPNEQGVNLLLADMSRQNCKFGTPNIVLRNFAIHNIDFEKMDLETLSSCKLYPHFSHFSN